MAVSKKRMFEVILRENRALLEKLVHFEQALTPNSVNSLQGLVRSLEEILFLHRRREEERCFPRWRGTFLRVEDPSPSGALREGHLFVTILREHLRGVGKVLIPIADRLLSPGEWDGVRKAFESIGVLSGSIMSDTK